MYVISPEGIRKIIKGE